jgi:membrane protease YdiL (CAAX protease family)
VGAREDDPWSEVLSAWAFTIALVYAAWRFLPPTAAPFGVALAWSVVPLALHLSRGRSLRAQGIAWRSIRASLRRIALYSAVFLPLYAFGFLALSGLAGWHVPSPQIFVFAFVGNLFFAALPEEIFFRGFVQPRLAGAAPRPPARRIVFVPLSRPIVQTAAIFAVTHVVFLPSPPGPFSLAGLERLTTFFPGLLFGALREDAGDVMTPALFHALCNAWLYCLQNGYLA